MEDQGVTSKLQQKVLRYYEYLWARNRGLKIKDLLADAPFCLQCEIYLSITFEMLQSVSVHIELCVVLSKHTCTRTLYLRRFLCSRTSTTPSTATSAPRFPSRFSSPEISLRCAAMLVDSCTTFAVARYGVHCSVHVTVDESSSPSGCR